MCNSRTKDRPQRYVSMLFKRILYAFGKSKFKSSIVNLCFDVSPKYTPHDFNQLVNLNFPFKESGAKILIYIGASAGVFPITYSVLNKIENLILYEFDPFSLTYLAKNCDRHKHHFKRIEIRNYGCSGLNANTVTIRSVSDQYGSATTNPNIASKQAIDITFSVKTETFNNSISDDLVGAYTDIIINSNGSESEIVQSILDSGIIFNKILLHKFDHIGDSSLKNVLQHCREIGLKIEEQCGFVCINGARIN